MGAILGTAWWSEGPLDHLVILPVSLSSVFHAFIISSSIRLTGEFSCPYLVKLGLQIIVFGVCRKHVLGIINLLSSLGKMLFYCFVYSVMNLCP